LEKNFFRDILDYLFSFIFGFYSISLLSSICTYKFCLISFYIYFIDIIFPSNQNHTCALNWSPGWLRSGVQSDQICVAHYFRALWLMTYGFAFMKGGLQYVQYYYCTFLSLEERERHLIFNKNETHQHQIGTPIVTLRGKENKLNWKNKVNLIIMQEMGTSSCLTISGILKYNLS